ncbi:hypothetical protein FOA52_012716 [Chlamydomonas sp. UWO 241]|nr:hypothetical protein FOA52_012716 [Chlamydomonas sp. UWO 241]
MTSAASAHHRSARPAHKSTSANHLLNFQGYGGAGGGGGGASGGRAGGGGGAGGSGARRGGGGSHHSTPTSHSQSGYARGGSGGGASQQQNRTLRYDRNSFLQANYRFLVSDAVDAARFRADADLMFDWDDVLLVEMMSPVPVQCAISLDSPPVCPQITPCGHVFSFASIMQHLVNHGGKHLRCSAPCPLCFAPVVARELRLLRVRPVSSASVGDTREFTLLKRRRNVIVPEPVTRPATAAPAAAPALGPSGPPSAAADSAPPGPAPFLGPAHASARNPAARNPAALRLPQDGLVSNVFAKFALTGSAAPLWRSAAAELAAYAAEVTSEGGLEAAITAPHVFAALDSLAARARKWAARRAEALGDPNPERAGAEAESVVKDCFTLGGGASVGAYAHASSSSSAVGAGVGAGGVGAAGGGQSQAQQQARQQSHSPLGGEFTFEAAFSDDDEDGGPAPPTGGVRALGLGAAAAAAAAPAGSPACAGSPPPPAASSKAVAVAQPPLGDGAGDGGAGGAGDLSGTSPTTALMNAPDGDDEYCMLQASDGTWVFLHPLNLRCLLHHYGSYDRVPHTLTAKVLELEDVVQGDATRRRWRFLAHLPATGSFRLAEVSLQGLLPPESLAQFADELGAREKRRRRKVSDERREAQREASDARAAAAARLGPSAQELAAMPSLGGGAGETSAMEPAGGSVGSPGDGSITGADVALQLAIEASLAAGGGGDGGAGGAVAWSKLVKLGFAATGPTLGSSPPPGGGPGGGPSLGAGGAGGAAVQPALSGAWGKKAGGPIVAAAGAGTEAATVGFKVVRPWGVLGAAPPAQAGAGGSGDGAAAGAPGSSGGSQAAAPKGKSKKGTLLFTTTQRNMAMATAGGGGLKRSAGDMEAGGSGRGDAPWSSSFTWRIENFSKLGSGEDVRSESFEAGIATWRLRVSPDEYGTGKGTHLSVYLEAQDTMWEPSTEFKFTLLNQADSYMLASQSFTHTFYSNTKSRGAPKLISLPELKSATAGWLVNDALVLRANVTVEREDRFQMDTGGAPCDVTLKLPCGLEVPAFGPFQ